MSDKRRPPLCNCVNPSGDNPLGHTLVCPRRKWLEDDIEVKLSFLRQDAADALCTFLTILTSNASGQQINLAALGYINAHTRYTLACKEARRGDILPYVEVPNDEH